MDATNLKKLVRSLATKDLHHGFQINHQLPPTIPLSHRQELGDSQIRRQMMNSVYPQNSQQQPITSSGLHLPQNLHSGSSRVGLPDGQLCSICSMFYHLICKNCYFKAKKNYILGINFYGTSALTRHMKMVHPNDFEIWEQDQAEVVVNMDHALPHEKMHHIEEIESNFKKIHQSIYFRNFLR